MARTGRPRSFDEAEVVERAMELFWRRGYAGTSLRDLSGELGLLPGSLYAAFGDKHQLFVKALERYAAGMLAATSGLSTGPALPRIGELLAGALAAAVDHPGRGCMLGNSAAELAPEDPAAAAVVREGLRALEGAIEAALLRGQREGEVRSEIDCAVQARLLVVLVQGLHVLARAETDPHRLDAVIRAALDPLGSPAPRRKR